MISPDVIGSVPTRQTGVNLDVKHHSETRQKVSLPYRRPSEYWKLVVAT
jgi:hypothetical protein